jgi:hypothetical protein
VIAETVASVKPGCVFIRTKQGFFRARVHWDIRATEFDCIEGIARRLPQFYVPGNDRDRSHANIWSAQRHDERHSVI